MENIGEKKQHSFGGSQHHHFTSEFDFVHVRSVPTEETLHGLNQFETHRSPQSPPHPMHRIPRVVPGKSKFSLKQSGFSARKGLSFTCNECWVLTILQGGFSYGLFKRSSDVNVVWRLILEAWEWIHTYGDVSNSVWPYNRVSLVHVRNLWPLSFVTHSYLRISM